MQQTHMCNKNEARKEGSQKTYQSYVALEIEWVTT